MCVCTAFVFRCNCCDCCLSILTAVVVFATVTVTTVSAHTLSREVWEERERRSSAVLTLVFCSAIFLFRSRVSGGRRAAGAEAEEGASTSNRKRVRWEELTDSCQASLAPCLAPFEQSCCSRDWTRKDSQYFFSLFRVRWEQAEQTVFVRQPEQPSLLGVLHSATAAAVDDQLWCSENETRRSHYTIAGNSLPASSPSPSFSPSIDEVNWLLSQPTIFFAILAILFYSG